LDLGPSCDPATVERAVDQELAALLKEIRGHNEDATYSVREMINMAGKENMVGEHKSDRPDNRFQAEAPTGVRYKGNPEDSEGGSGAAGGEP
jgi:hypothetical protein